MLDHALFDREHIEDSPYEVYALNEKTVVFFTETGIEYIVGFVEDASLELSDTYQIYLTKKQSDKVIGTDPNIGKTITAIVRSFFGNKRNVLTYIINTKRQEIESLRIGFIVTLPLMSLNSYPMRSRLMIVLIIWRL